jgi:hypothetical protein
MTVLPFKQRDMFTGRWRTVRRDPLKESAMQIQLVSMLRLALRPDVLMRHIPNGEHRDPRTAAKLKAMGVLPGCPDLEFHWCEVENGEKRRRCLHLELKRGNGRASESQVAFALAARLLGDEYHIARSIDAAIIILGERGLIKRGVEVAGRRW